MLFKSTRRILKTFSVDWDLSKRKQELKIWTPDFLYPFNEGLKTDSSRCSSNNSKKRYQSYSIHDPWGGYRLNYKISLFRDTLYFNKL